MTSWEPTSRLWPWMESSCQITIGNNLLKSTRTRFLNPLVATGCRWRVQFIRYCFEAVRLDLPRNIESKNLVINYTPGEIKPMPVDALQSRVKAATGRLKLELLLMANCGMYQVDCAELKHSEVDWKAGTITRRRTKTKRVNSNNIPIVMYYLWPTTLDLLRKFANSESQFVLATRNGMGTVHSTINADGKASRTDSTAQAYKRLQDELGGTRWHLKSIRKAGATAIGNSTLYSRFAQHYLGDSPRTITDSHYVRPSEEQFKACLEWLGTEFKLDTQAAIGGA